MLDYLVCISLHDLLLALWYMHHEILQFFEHITLLTVLLWPFISCNMMKTSYFSIIYFSTFFMEQHSASRIEKSRPLCHRIQNIIWHLEYTRNIFWSVFDGHIKTWVEMSAFDSCVNRKIWTAGLFITLKIV